MSQDAESAADPAVQADPDGLNGYVVVALEGDQSGVQVDGDVDDLVGVATALGLDDVVSLLGELGSPRTTALIPAEQRGTVLALENRARENNPRRSRHSLLLFWRIDATGTDLAPEALAEALSVLRGVHAAYAEAVITESVPVVRTDDQRARRAAPITHRDPAPDGVDAGAAWAHRGGDGAGVRFVDLEQGWRIGNPTLPPGLAVLPDKLRVNRDGIGPYVGDHGTSVVGIVAGVDTGAGVVGLARGLDAVAAASHYDRDLDQALHVAAAIDQAVAELISGGPGGVLLVEVERGPESKQLPTETEYADFQAITTAVDNGVVVVEAAANAPRDLDAWTGANPKRRMLRGDPDFDSGAIVVGACVASLAGAAGHYRLSSSNWGGRVDCHAWGAQVWSPTATGFAEFGGTSAASAIIAGVAAVVQGMVIAAHGPDAALTPEKLRALLSDHHLGTPQVPPGTAKQIGSMPDLRRLAAAVGARRA
jgi:serine protease